MYQLQYKIMRNVQYSQPPTEDQIYFNVILPINDARDFNFFYVSKIKRGKIIFVTFCHKGKVTRKTFFYNHASNIPLSA